MSDSLTSDVSTFLGGKYESRPSSFASISPGGKAAILAAAAGLLYTAVTLYRQSGTEKEPAAPVTGSTSAIEKDTTKKTVTSKSGGGTASQSTDTKAKGTKSLEKDEYTPRLLTDCVAKIAASRKSQQYAEVDRILPQKEKEGDGERPEAGEDSDDDPARTGIAPLSESTSDSANDDSEAPNITGDTATQTTREDGQERRGTGIGDTADDTAQPMAQKITREGLPGKANDGAVKSYSSWGEYAEEVVQQQSPYPTTSVDPDNSVIASIWPDEGCNSRLAVCWTIGKNCRLNERKLREKIKSVYSPLDSAWDNNLIEGRIWNAVNADRSVCPAGTEFRVTYLANVEDGLKHFQTTSGKIANGSYTSEWQQ